jgi:predicted dehydrogenase
MFDPRYIEAVKLIQDGEIGKITQIRAYWHRNNDWRRPVPEGHPELEKKINWRLYQAFSGGLMTELASHQIQVANWFKNDVPVQVMGKGSINYWKDGREVYDNVALVYSYADGTQFVYDSLTSNRHYGLEEQIMGDKGTLEMEVNKKYPEEKYLPKPPGIVQLINDIQRDVFSQSIAILGSSWVPELKIQKEGVAIADKQDDFSETKMELEAFVDTVREGKPVEGVFEQGYWATVWALLGLQAMDEQTIVTLPDYLKL